MAAVTEQLSDSDRGKAIRAEVPRSVACRLGAGCRRRAIRSALLEEQAKTRVPELVPIRYGRMLVSAFTFFRGAAYIMAADLAEAPRTGLEVQLCGDAHLSNFGGFAAPDRRLVFSLNDFDETLPGPFEWDVKRLVASFAVAGRDRGFSAKQRRADQPRGRARLPRGDAGLRRDAERSISGTPVWKSTRSRAAGRRQATSKRVQAVRAQRRQGANEGQPAGLRQAHRDRRRRAAHHQRPADRRPDRGAHGSGEPDQIERRDARSAFAPTGARC